MMKQEDVAPLMSQYHREMETEDTSVLKLNIHVWQEAMTELQLRIITAQAIIIEREEVNG